VSDGQGGRTFDAPVEIKCRWEERQELYTDTDGQERRSNAVVFPDRAVDVGDYLYLGDLDDLTSSEEADPQSVSEAWEVMSKSNVTDRLGNNPWRKVWL
jgi:hypothetical protein